jgi:hypothetical protein
LMVDVKAGLKVVWWVQKKAALMGDAKVVS